MLLRYNIYFNGFIFCEFLNFAIVLVQFFITNRFLSRRFLLYGLEVPLMTVMLVLIGIDPQILSVDQYELKTDYN